MNESYCKQVQDALDNIAARDKRAIVELHDYMRLPQRVAAKSGYRRDASGAVVDARGNRVGDLAAAEPWADTYPLRNVHDVGYLDSRDQLLKLYEYRVIGTPGARSTTMRACRICGRVSSTGSSSTQRYSAGAS